MYKKMMPVILSVMMCISCPISAMAADTADIQAETSIQEETEQEVQTGTTAQETAAETAPADTPESEETSETGSGGENTAEQAADTGKTENEISTEEESAGNGDTSPAPSETPIQEEKPAAVEENTEEINEKAAVVTEEVVVEESYTSKASFPDGDTMPVYGKEQGMPVFSGTRKGGLYRTAGERLINADVNGAANIARKYNPLIFPNEMSADYICGTVIAVKHSDILRISQEYKRNPGQTRQRACVCPVSA